MSDAELDIEQLRNLIRQYIDCQLYKTAQFWADKVCTLSKNEPQDVIWLAHTLFLTKQYFRAGQLLKTHGLTSTNFSARYLAAKCYYEAKDWKSALDILDGETKDIRVERRSIKSYNTNSTSIDDLSVNSNNDNIGNDDAFFGILTGSKKCIRGATSYLKGLVHEELENKEAAIQCYKSALQMDIFCFEALDILISYNALTAADERSLLDSLPYHQISNEEAKLVKFVYESKINKYAKPVEVKLENSLKLLENNLDHLVCIAERHFNNYNFREAYNCTLLVVKSDPLHEKCLPILISCLYELNKKNNLYNLAHELVNMYPTKCISWYAIATYYLLISNNEMARKYFTKSTSLDTNFGPAWLGFAHSFVSEGEHDQAISAYFSASKLMTGSHLPYLYLGIEYALNNNLKLALKFYKDALALSPDDPHIKHELGSFYYQNGEYDLARSYFNDALNRIQTVEAEITQYIWEPLFNNLGHVSRKLKDYDLAIQYHERALMVSPKNGGTCAAIGLNYMLKGDIETAIFKFHQALSIKKDDTLTIELLNNALEFMNLTQGYSNKEENSIAEESQNCSQLEVSQESSSKSLSCIEMSMSDSLM